MKTLEPGVVYKVNELLPIHSSINLYESGLKVIPDNINWFKVQCSDGTFAFPKESEHQFIQSKDITGEYFTVHKRYSHYIQCEDSNGKPIYFTDEAAAEAYDFKFSLRLQKFWDKKCNNFFGNEKILCYHNSDAVNWQSNSNCPAFINDNDEYIIGLEVEKVDEALRNKGLVYELLQTTGWRKEIDGSLSDGGFELVSPKLPLFDNTRIAAALEPVRDYLNADSDQSCGGHITISRKGVSSYELLRNFKGFVPIIYAIYENRLNNYFCEAKRWRNYFNRPTKRSAFYLKNSQVLEIRLPSRFVSYNVLQWRVKLMQIFVSDYGKNLNQFLLKMSATESKLYKHLAEQYSHEKICRKIAKAAEFAERYGCGKVSNSIRRKINDRVGYQLLTIS